MKPDYSLIPESFMSNLLNYVEGTENPSGFLYAILTNDLFGSMAKADREIKPLIPLIVQYIWWEVPAGCHGSEEIVENWMKEKKGLK